ncbi:MAG: TonB-dependent receptor [Gammaproteobacteria bacterium]|nr:TonB-dependent receptor [Gammaproteobacteria bacterium]
MKNHKFYKNILLLAGALANSMMVSSTLAAEDANATDGDENKMVITGSRIKRTEAEGALPVTTFTLEELTTQGISSAEQMMLQLNISSNSVINLASSPGIVTGSERGNNGASSADLRGQGSESTLVLLNGRRVASHGMKGRAVDLNSIPFFALERVEVLRDGASAVYGTDAIGGVVNFILKKDYEGIDASAFADITEAGGGNIFRYNIMAGFGDLNSEGYNVMATLSLKENQILRGNERDFTSTFQPDRGLSPDTRGTPFASVNDRWDNPNDPTSSHYNLIGSGLLNPLTGDYNSTLNILALPGMPGCDIYPDMGVDTGALWNRPHETVSCAWDYPRASVLQQPVDKIDFVSRATFNVGDLTEAYVEVVASKVETRKIFEPNQITPWNFYDYWYPSTGSSYDMIVGALSDFYGEDQLNLGAPIAFRWRCMDCGEREINTTTKANRILFGIDGAIRDWEYTAGLSRASSESESELGGGYHYYEELADLFGTGTLNPFLLPGETQTAEALAGLEAASARGVVLYGGKTILTQLDASFTTELDYELGGGFIAFATGFDLRREEYIFNGDRRATEERPDIYQAPFDDADEIDNKSRDVRAVYAEALLPLGPELELSVAIRHDNYSGFGGTTNPKVGVKFSPSDSLLFRGGFSTGFRVPSFHQLFSGYTLQPWTGTDMADPAFCEDGIVDVGNPLCAEAINPNIISGGDVNLSPEDSEQSSFGFVWQFNDESSFNIDWWEITTNGTVQVPGLTRLLENYDLYSANFIRDGSGAIVSIDNRFINAGERVTSGVEVGFQSSGELGAGQWSLNFNSSYLIEDRKKLDDNVPFEDNEVGTHSRGNIPLQWKHTINFSYDIHDWNHSLAQIYRHSYLDEVPSGIENGDAVDIAVNWDPIVDSYTTYNYSVAYSGFENFDLRFGIKYLLDQEPPFTAHKNDWTAGAAFDPRVADPRGRAFTFQVDYKFK